MNITLIGMPGAGKSSIGKKLAEELHYSFIDADETIKKNTGLKLQDIIDRYGETAFLEMEQRVIMDLAITDKLVICTGGSVVYSEKAMHFLKKNSIIIFLNAELKTLKKNINNLNLRGIIGLSGKSLTEIYKERYPLYKKYADITVNIFRETNIKKHVKSIIKILPRN